MVGRQRSQRTQPALQVYGKEKRQQSEGGKKAEARNQRKGEKRKTQDDGKMETGQKGRRLSDHLREKQKVHQRQENRYDYEKQDNPEDDQQAEKENNVLCKSKSLQQIGQNKSVWKLQCCKKSKGSLKNKTKEMKGAKR